MASNPSIKQPTVRINAAAKQKLDRLQAETDLSQPALMDRAIDLLEREITAEQMRSDFVAIAEDPDTLALYNAVASSFSGVPVTRKRR